MVFTTYEKLALNSDNWDYYYNSEIKCLEKLYENYTKKVHEQKITNKTNYMKHMNFDSQIYQLYQGTGEILYQLKKPFLKTSKF